MGETTKHHCLLKRLINGDILVDNKDGLGQDYNEASGILTQERRFRKSKK